ncbi:MAG: cytochrome c oxidase subunit II, partial [Acidobacteria bacterium]
MKWSLPLFPTGASTLAGEVDALYIFLIAISGLMVTLIGIAILVFGIRYRRRAASQEGTRVVPSLALEISWSVLPLIVGLVLFAWGANVYFAPATPPAETLAVSVVSTTRRWQ